MEVKEIISVLENEGTVAMVTGWQTRRDGCMFCGPGRWTGREAAQILMCIVRCGAVR